MNLPAVTVVVPAFNAEAWISESLSSVVAQDYPKDRLEVVVVDDGSTDRTTAVANEALKDAGVLFQIIANPSALGPSAARNRGWLAGRGEWVQFLDADDRLAAAKIARQAGAAGAARPEIAALHSAWARLSLRNGQWIPELPAVQPDTGAEPLLDLLRDDNFMQLGCLLFSRRWLERVNGFDESLRFIEDVDLLLRLSMSGGELQQVATAEPLAFYRQHSGSLSKSNDTAFVEGCIRNAKLVERFWRDGGSLTTSRQNALARIYFMGAHFFSGRDANRFDALVRDLRRVEPGFVPPGPPALRLLTMLFGYPRAERCAVQYRRLRQTLRPQAGA